MRLIINGEAQVVSGAVNVAELLVYLGLNPRRVAVERNLKIAPRSTHTRIALIEGDRIEIVHFIGGG